MFAAEMHEITQTDLEPAREARLQGDLDRDSVFRRHLELAKRKTGIDYEVCLALAEALRAELWTAFGWSGILEYADRVFGLGPRAACDRLRVAQELDRLPEIAAAFRGGSIAWSAVREITRNARPDNEGRWLAVATGKTLREVEELVAARGPHDEPDGPPNDRARRHRVTFNLPADVYALLRDAIGALRREHGGQLDEDEALGMMARKVLEGPSDPGRSSYQVQMTVCERCQRGWQDGRGAIVAVGSEVVERSSCDAQVVQGDGSTSQDVPPRIRRKVMRRDHGRCRVTGCRSAVFLDLHHIQLRSEGSDHDPDRLIVLCGAHHAAVREGRLFIEGTVSKGLSFTAADGTPYGEILMPSDGQRFADVFSALRNLGCKEGQAKRAIGQVQAHVGPDESVEQILRRCLLAL
jgi:hypothetical protein